MILEVNYLKGKIRGLYCKILSLYPKALANYLYRRLFHRNINWKSPRDLNEWINVLMHNGDVSMWIKLADKYRVREYIAQKGLSDILVPLYGYWTNPSDIELSNLPSDFVLKSNNGCETVRIVHGDITQSEIEALASLWLNLKFGAQTNEPHYRKIKPCVLAEKYLDSSKQAIKATSLIDYKIWCIMGKPEYIWTAHNRTKATVVQNLYDVHWNDCSHLLNYDNHFIHGEKIPKPKCLDRMLNVASILADGFPQVRIDLYLVDDRIYFGEMTFSSSSGRMLYMKDSLLQELGSKIQYTI